MRSSSVFLALALLCAVPACSNTDDGAAGAERGDALSEASDRIVLAAANTLDENVLDRDVGLGPTTARKIVKTRPFATMAALRKVLPDSDVRRLLQYRTSSGSASSDAALVMLGCSEREGESGALDLEWTPPAPLSFVGGPAEGPVYHEHIPFKATVADDGVTATASYEGHSAKLSVKRASRIGTFELDGHSYGIECHYVKTTRWEAHP